MTSLACPVFLVTLHRGDYYHFPIFRMSKLRHKEIKKVSWSCTVGKRQVREQERARCSRRKDS